MGGNIDVAGETQIWNSEPASGFSTDKEAADTVMGVPCLLEALKQTSNK